MGPARFSSASPPYSQPRVRIPKVTRFVKLFSRPLSDGYSVLSLTFPIALFGGVSPPVITTVVVTILHLSTKDLERR